MKLWLPFSSYKLKCLYCTTSLYQITKETLIAYVQIQYISTKIILVTKKITALRLLVRSLNRINRTLQNNNNRGDHHDIGTLPSLMLHILSLIKQPGKTDPTTRKTDNPTTRKNAAAVWINNCY